MPTPELKKMLPANSPLRPIRLALLRHAIQQSVDSYFGKNRSALALTGILIAGVSVPAFYAAPVSAAGLERLNVLSSLGQPLRAEIDISATAAESGSLSVRLAPTSAYAQANVEFGPALSSLRFTLERRANGQPYVRVSSTQPVNEPYIDMLVELNWSSGRLVREYTFLLDPPEMRPATQAPVASPVNPPAANRSSAPAPVERAAPASPLASNGNGNASPSDGNYRVKSGDTLMKIAKEHKPENASLDQMLVALFRNNQDAFFGQNINRLKAGVVMRIPDTQAAQAVESGEARNFLSAQTSDFSAYRSGLAQSVTESTKLAEPRNEASGRVSAKLEEKSAPAATQDQVKLSKLADQTKQDAAAKASAEELAAKERVVQEANTRVSMLEKNVADLEKLVELKNQNLAELQKQLQAKAAPAGTASPATATPEAAVPPPVAPAAVKPAVPVQPAPPKVESPKSAPAEESFLDSLTGNPAALYGLGAVVIALLGFAGYRSFSRKKKASGYDDSFLGSNSGLRANSIFGMTGGQSVDTTNSTFNSNFLPMAGAQVEQNDVDPIAEAEVYIAYGRDAQAEEILKEALRTQPERHAVHLKLLEIYAKRQDVKSFETTANELYAATGGQGADWAEAATMGRTVDPSNPLYADAAANSLPEKAAAAVQTAASKTTGAESSLLSPNTTALDFSFPETTAATVTSEGAPTTRMDFKQNTISSPTTLNPVLDMDLTKTEPMTTVSSEPEPSAVSDMDLDFSLNDPVAPSLPPLKPAQTTSAVEDVQSTDDWAMRSNVDFSFDLQDGTVASSVTRAEEAPMNVPPLMAEPMENLMQTVHIEHPVTPAKNTDDIDLDLSLNSPSLDAKSPTSTDFNASAFSNDRTLVLNTLPRVPEINLDLDSVTSSIEQTGYTKTEVESNHGGNWQDMATKLDLAMAYRDIGDKEGARELLDEVIKGGDGVQSDKAKELLASIS